MVLQYMLSHQTYHIRAPLGIYTKKKRKYWQWLL